MEKVNNSINSINEKFEEMETDRKVNKGQVSELKNKIKPLIEKVETMDRSIGCHEQSMV